MLQVKSFLSKMDEPEDSYISILIEERMRGKMIWAEQNMDDVIAWISEKMEEWYWGTIRHKYVTLVAITGTTIMVPYL